MWDAKLFVFTNGVSEHFAMYFYICFGKFCECFVLEPSLVNMNPKIFER